MTNRQFGYIEPQRISSFTLADPHGPVVRYEGAICEYRFEDDTIVFAVRAYSRQTLSTTPAPDRKLHVLRAMLIATGVTAEAIDEILETA